MVGVGIGVGVSVGMGVLVGVGTGVHVGIGVHVGTGVAVGVFVSVGDGCVSGGLAGGDTEVPPLSAGRCRAMVTWDTAKAMS